MRLTPLAIAVALAACSPHDGLNIGQTSVAVVTGRDDQNVSGSINTVDLHTKAVKMGIDTTLDADHVVRANNARLYVLNRTSGNVRVYDAVTFAVLAEVKTGDGMSYPQDLYPVPSSTEVVVSFAGNLAAQAVGVLDTANPAGGISRYISVPQSPNDPDGKPEPFPIHYCNGLFYVGLGDYDSVTTFAPTGPGRLAVIDVKQSAAVGVVQLAHENPTAITPLGSDCNTVLVSGSGPFGVAPDTTSGIDRVDLKAATATSLFDGATLMGVPNQLQVVSPSLAIVVLSYDLQTVVGMGYQILARQRLVAFNPATLAIIGDASDKAGYIAFFGVAPDGDAWFGTDNFNNVDTTGNLPVGVWVGAANGQDGPYTSVDIGQHPYTVSFP